ncbi:MAG: adenylate cyclase [Solirubrobacteraceae bacterium]|jgi:CYTH domain-containing protein|nr:adenylate cyclase [Solirubrobacteraceae bacterium]
MRGGIEIERKFLLHGVPPTMRFAHREAMRQGYVALDGDTEVRIRITPEGGVLTIKAGRGGVRVEQEIALAPRQAEALWELTEGRRVQKTRRRVRLAGGAAGADLVAEVDEYAGALDGLVVAEVEFPDEEAARGFKPPAWFGRELTDDWRYANRSLASDGMPEEPAGDEPPPAAAA